MSPSAKFLNVRVALGITDTIPLDSWHANLFLARSKLPNYDSPGLYFSVFLLEIDTGLVYFLLNAGDQMCLRIWSFSEFKILARID